MPSDRMNSESDFPRLQNTYRVMASEIKLWQLHEGKLQDVNDSSFATEHLEKELEDLIEKNSTLLGDDLIIIDRQREIRSVGIFDLLCIDAGGKFVIVELKRDQTPREAVAQALHYASWLDAVDETEILGNAHGNIWASHWTLRLRTGSTANCRNSIFTIIESYWSRPVSTVQPSRSRTT